MIPVKSLSDLTGKDKDTLFNRFGEDFSSVMIDTVVPIIRDVKENGDLAVKKYTERFDGVHLDSLIATGSEFAQARSEAPGDVMKAFREARANIEEFHDRQKRQSSIYSRDDGFTLGVLHQPIEKAAIYVPGGKASYPSSVLMGVIPAKIAGVKDITVVTPPDSQGTIPPVVLSLCEELNVSRVLKSGGAQGIAAAGIGTESVPKADIIVGPGNVYVTAAKTYLFSLGMIQIDSMAGPSEVLIIADENADAKWVAWDLLSQAEHEEMALAVLVTTSKILAEKVADEIKKDIDSGRGRHDIKKKVIASGTLILIADNIHEAIEFSNMYAPEHMELMVQNPLEYLGIIKNVGSLFLGYHAPVAVGDYFSGTNHILPTGGAARFSSGTSVETFMRRTTFQLPSRRGLEQALPGVVKMSGYEGFDDKHGDSLAVRFRNE